MNGSALDPNDGYEKLRQEFAFRGIAVGAFSVRMEQRKPSILVVDDQPMTISALIYGFEKAGCRAHLASSVQGALEAVAIGEFDGALLDYQMPVLTGLELAEKLQLIARAKAQTWPIWLMTGAPTPAIYQRASELRIRNVFVKPFDFIYVINELASTLGSIVTARADSTR